MKKSRIFFYSCLFFILGIGFASYFSIPLWISFIFLILGCASLFVGWPKNQKIIIIGLGGIFLFLGIFRYEVSQPQNSENEIKFYNGEEVTFFGKVDSEPDIRENHVKLIVNSSQLTIDNKKIHVDGKVLVNAKLYPEYYYGDELEISCTLREPEPIDDFAYDKYLAKSEIYSLCYWPEIKLVATGQGNKLIGVLLLAKNKFVQTVNRILPEPQASFLGGLLYGARRSIPSDLMDKFNITGTTHIIAISGYNITILAALLLKLTKGIGIPRKKSFWFVLSGILFFVIIAGAQASVVRAAIMGGLVLLASQVGRVSRITNALLAAAAAMLIFNPKVLAFDVGFQLSFAATVGLIFLAPAFEKYLKKWPSVFGVKESFATTMAAIVLTLPLILYNFGRLSLVAPLANILILLVIPLTMALGFVAVLGGLVYLGLGQILAWLAWFFLSYIIKVTELLAGISWASARVGRIHWVMLLMMYLVIAGFIWWQYRTKQKVKELV